MASKKQTVISRPVARTQDVVVEAVGNETVVYDTTLHIAHALQPLAAAVFAYADGKNTVAEIAELASYRLDHTVSEADVLGALEVLEANSLLDGPVLDVQTGVSRRTALKTFAAAGAGSMLVMSIATSAAQACITCPSPPPSTDSCATAGVGGIGPGDCKICQSAGICNTTGSVGHCCCAPCDDNGSFVSYCCQPVCINRDSKGQCPSGTLPLSVSVGSPSISCPTGYGAFQAYGYQYKCCKVGTSKYCKCVTVDNQCGYWSGSTCQAY